MADTIKIGNLNISAFKVGNTDCNIYLGSTLLYSGGTTPPTPTLQWVTFSNGDTIPSDLDIYGFSGVSQNLLDTFGYGEHFQFTASRNRIEWNIANNISTCYVGDTVLDTDVISAICSEVSCDEYYNQGATVSGTIQLYIYA